MQQYIATIDYPKEAISENLEGILYVSFTVDQKGEVVEVELLNELGNLLDEVSLNHIRNMPKFASPGKQRGKKVKVKYKVPIKFELK